MQLAVQLTLLSLALVVTACSSCRSSHQGGGAQSRQPVDGRRGRIRSTAAADGRRRWHIDVKLHPHSSSVGRKMIVSFGLPLPPGVVEDPQNVRVLSGGQEIASHVSVLGRWRRVPPRELLCRGLPTPRSGGLRALLVQIELTIGSPAAGRQAVTVELGRKRMHSRPERAAPRTGWREVSDGSYGGLANLRPPIREPAVYATLPAKWLACSNIVALATVMGEHRDLAAFDHGQVAFFFTTFNAPKANPRGLDPKERIDYFGDHEPWLYDRAMAFYAGYVRSGRLPFLREAHRATQHYMRLIYGARECGSNAACAGFHRKKNDEIGSAYKDSKYSYNESMVTLHWLTGDPAPLARLSEVTKATQHEITLSRPISEMKQWFTERHHANALLAPLFEYEVTGDDKLAKLVTSGISALHRNQTRPFPAGSNNPVNGCWNHDLEQTGLVGISPWKMSLLVHALLRAYHTLGDRRVPRMIVAAARCVLDRAIYTPTERNPKRLAMPREEVNSFGPPQPKHNTAYTDFEHAIDVAYVTALGALFSRDARLKARLIRVTRQLLATHTDTLDHWTRRTGWPDNHRALYRVNPPRKYAWWYKNSGAIGWALDGPTRIE